MKPSKKVYIRSFLFLAMLMVGVGDLYAQIDERTIKLSREYYWGEGFGEDRQSAINNAKRDLIEKMIVRIDSESSFSERDTNDDYEVSLETNTNTMSRIELRGLNYLPAEERRDGTWEAIAYVSIEDFNTTMAIEKDRLLSSLSIATKDEEEGRLDAAIPQYMDILASTFYSPVPFYTTDYTESDSVELRSFLASKIRNWVNNLDIEVQRVRSLSTSINTEFYFDFAFKYNGVETSHLEMALNKAGYAAHPIRNGRTSVFYDLAPEELTRPFTFTLSPIIPSSIDSDKAAILDGVLPLRELTIDIDFSDVIEVDFDVTGDSDDGFTFIPEIKNLSVYSLEWDFGDGATSSETSPTHTFGANFTESIVSLTINGSADLLKKKVITASGALRDELTTSSNNSRSNPVNNESSSSEVTNSEAQAFSVPSRQQSYIENVIRQTDGQSLTVYLNRLKMRQILDLGRRSDVSNPDRSYLAIINPQSRLVVAVLSPVTNGKRYNLATKNPIADQDIADVFKGMGSVWFQFK